MKMVCIGDSFTEGLHDVPRPDGRPRGWADRVAQKLAQQAPVDYANLAVRGKLLAQIRDEQLHAALALEPDLLTVHAGANDILRPGVDIEQIARAYELMLSQTVAPDRTVVVFTSIGRAGGTGRLATALAERFARMNDKVREIAHSYNFTLVDLEKITVLSDRRMWDVDRLHLNPAGHERVAAAVLHALEASNSSTERAPSDTWWTDPLPPAPALTRTQALAQDAQWIRGHLVPWVGRRLRGTSSGDGLTAKQPHLQREETPAP